MSVDLSLLKIWCK